MERWLRSKSIGTNSPGGLFLTNARDDRKVTPTEFHAIAAKHTDRSSAGMRIDPGPAEWKI